MCESRDNNRAEPQEDLPTALEPQAAKDDAATDDAVTDDVAADGAAADDDVAIDDVAIEEGEAVADDVATDDVEIVDVVADDVAADDVVAEAVDDATECDASESEEVWVAADGTSAEGAAGEEGDDCEVIELEEPEVVDVEALQAEFMQAHEMIHELAARLRMVSKAYQEQKDDMAAFRKRVEDQGKVKEGRASFDAVQAFFDPVQNLKRSLAAPGTEVQPLVEGLGLVVSQFVDALEKLGLEETPGEGSDFNPEYHEALAVMPVTDADLDGKVVMVHAAGYTVAGKVLQASQVVIGKFTPEEEVAEA
ncbi:MAG: nucleotide exchange factor GrpE [Proteobacteria bacterium]|jgi:molecular chaperone GrpE|nr:nucleotide exchange factor GrpE [Pseudomonadota bacterium]